MKTITRLMRVRISAAAAFMMMISLFAVAAPPAQADVTPAGCTQNAFAVNLNKSVNTAYNETNPNGPTTIVYSIEAGNTGSNPCNVDNVTITVKDPHGTSHTIETGGSYPAGSPLVTLPTTVSYVANSADEVSNKLVASVQATGDLHDTRVGTDPLNVNKTVSVTVIHPNTKVAVTPSVTAVQPGGTVTLTVTEQNTGDEDLSSPQVTLTPPGTVLNKASATYTGGDTDSDGTLSVGETWTWIIPGVVVSATTDYTAVGDGIDSLGNHVTAPSYPDESGSAKVSVVDANIQISPAAATNKKGDPHTLTGHVNVNDGTGFANAPAGTQINFTITSGPGSLSAPSCTTVGSTGSCTVTLSSSVTGVTIVNASTDPVVSGLTLHRTTDGVGLNSGPANKTWVDLQILIDANSTNEVRHTHTFTVTVNADPGTGTFAPISGATVAPSVSAPGALTGTGSCQTGQTDASGHCTIIVNSTTAGTGTISATATATVGGVSISRSLGDGLSGDSAKATKTWVDAKLVLSPLTATNPINQAHTITATVTQDPGTGSVAAPDGTLVTFSLLSNTASATFVGGVNTCITSGGSCAVQINTPTPGSVDIHATVTLSVSGVSLTRATGDGLSGDSANANKLYEAGKIIVKKVTDPSSDTTTVFTFTNSGTGYSGGFTLTGGTQNDSGPLAAGTYTVAETPLSGWSLTTATCDHGQTPDNIVLAANQTVTCTFTNKQLIASISIVKKTNGDDANLPTGPNIPVGGAVNWTYEVTNTGNVELTSVVVTDSKGVAVTCPKTVLAALESMTCTASGTAVAGQYENTGTVTGHPSFGPDVTASDPSHYFGTQQPSCPAGSFAYTVDGDGLHIVYDQFPAPNDNSYGVNAVGWPNGHKFSDLTGSDKAGFQIKNPSGTVVLSFNMDYISAKSGTPSGYASLGAFGGDGSVLVGSLTPADAVFESSLQRNLNGSAEPNHSDNGSLPGGKGFCTAGNCTISGVNLLVDSPPTADKVSNYTLTNAAFTGWDFHDTYYVTINKAKLQNIGFLDSGGNPVAGWKVEPNLTVLHNSPSKPCPGTTLVCSVDTAPKLTLNPDSDGGVWVTYQQSTNLNDNSYGINAVSWGTKGHKFSDLTGSDKARILVKNTSTGATVFDGFFDYISAKVGTPSGYDTLGVTGGDGSVSTGQASWILPDSSTSFAQNLNFNVPFISALLTNSPAVNPANSYTPVDSTYNTWDFNDTYYVHISKDAFIADNPAGYDASKFDITVPSVHNSPAKVCVANPPTPPADSPSYTTLKSVPPPPPGEAITAATALVKDKDFKVKLTNLGSVKATIQSVTVAWPDAANGALQNIKLDGSTIYDTPDLTVSPTAPITTFKGTTNDRSISAGQTREFKLHFANTAAGTGYTIIIDFGSAGTKTITL